MTTGAPGLLRKGRGGDMLAKEGSEYKVVAYRIYAITYQSNKSAMKDTLR